MGLFSRCGGKLGVPLELQRVSRGTSLVVKRDSRLLLSFKREYRIALESLQGKRASSRVCAWGWGMGNLMVFLKLQWDFRVMIGNSGNLSCFLREVQSPFELQWGAGDCSQVTTRQIHLMKTCVQKLRVPLQWRQGSQCCIQTSARESGLISSGSKELCPPPEL